MASTLTREDKFSQILFYGLALLILLSVAATYYNTIIDRNFVIIDDLDEMMEEEEF